MDQFAKLRDYVLGLEKEFEKFFVKENNAAGTRLRKAMQEVKKICQEIRDDVQSRRQAAKGEDSK